MHPHIKIRLKERLPIDPPHWLDVVANASLAQQTFHPHVDALFEERKIPFIATSEYQPRGTAWTRPEIDVGLNRVYRLVLKKSGRVPADLIKQISLIPIVDEVNPGTVGDVDLPPLRAVQMGAPTGTDSRDAIYLNEAHQYTEGHPDITIAVLDTGVSQRHPELQHAMLPGFDTVNIIDGAREFLGDFLQADEDPEDEVGHGTHVAGIICGKGLRMPSGIVPRCKILPVRVLAAMLRDGKRVGAGLVDNINFGVKWAVDHGADVINMSLGIRHTEGGLPHEEVVAYAKKMNVTIIAASGNDGREQLYYPGALPDVIAVGATAAFGDVSSFSTFGKQVSFVAPGEQIYSSYLDNDYAFSTGTSHAAPFVAGAVAMLKSYALKNGRRFFDKHVKHILKHTSDKLDTRFKHPKAGFGRLNLIDALRLAEFKMT